MPKLEDHFDAGSLIVIVITFVLFAAALFTKGLTHDLLLEVAVFLVSVKLIMMSYKLATRSDRLERRLDRIEGLLKGK